ncbi:protein adenylyltransferase SelO family protein, partial [Bifidobacterium thermophilum]|nr:protein adenylyltransferase SelO family protein [Bifidobacterium thermophilum]
WGKLEDLRALADYAIQRHYPEIEPDENRYLSFLEEVIERQAALVAKWQLVGFIHGVMNTDNMTISGETIDYGPCAFMDVYDPKTVFS